MIRNGNILNINIIIKSRNRLCKVNLYDKNVEYFIFGGLVFLPLSRPYLQHKYGKDNWTKKCPVTLKYYYFKKKKEYIDQQIVILSQVLASDTTVGYHNLNNLVLKTINDNQLKIKNLKHLCKIVDNLVKNKKNNKFIKFQFESSEIIVLNINQAINSVNNILKRHKIEYDRSDNLRNYDNNLNNNNNHKNDKNDSNDNKNEKDKDDDITKLKLTE